MKLNGKIMDFFLLHLIINLVINIDFQTHLPGYIVKADELKSKGISEIFCISVNDPFVMAAWGKEQGATGKVNVHLIIKLKKLNLVYHDCYINLNLFCLL